MSSCCTTNPPTCDCSIPQPRTSFPSPGGNGGGGPLCLAIGEFLYEPANCDPGYWCGCSSSNPKDCYPSNTTTKWFGHFTSVDNTTNTTITYVGGNVASDGAGFPLSNYDAKCRPGYYCPGKTNPFRCVDLCEPKSVCSKDGSSMKKCPKGYYCPIGTTEPRKCKGMEGCNDEGLRRFTVGGAMILIAVVLILSIIYLFGRKRMIISSSKKIKEMKSREKNERLGDNNNEEEKKIGANTQDGDYHHNEEEKEEELIGNNPNKAIHSSSVISSTSHSSRRESALHASLSRRKSIVTSPEMIIDIEFEDLSLSLPRVGTIMNGVSGKLQHGNLTAIMGPSGAGKTTFLNLMSGKVDRTGGTLKVNGEVTELTKYRRIIGFVPQEDVMMRDLTVEENVRHSALMRLPADWSMEKKLERVDETLESLEIDHVRDSVVGDERRRGVSGGQRKRVNIAIEMVTKPSLLCLDEPTSGLDSTTSLTVLQSLKDMADSGANIITVLHQPKYEIFLLFDQILLLGKGGMTVYYGSADGVASYFEKQGFPLPHKANPADFYMDVLSGIIPHPSNPNFDTDDLFIAWMCAAENEGRISHKEAVERMRKIRERAESEKKQKKEISENDTQIQKMIGMITNVCSNTWVYFGDLFAHVAQDFKEDESDRTTPGPFSQFVLLFKRASLQRVRSPFVTVINIILMALAGSVIPALVPSDAILYKGIPKSLETNDELWDAFLHQNVMALDLYPGLLGVAYFFMIIVSCLSVNVLGSERTVFFRETATGQSVGSYWAAKTLETLLWLPLYSASFVLLGYGSAAWFLQPLAKYWVFLMFVLMGAYGVGMLSSLLFGSGTSGLGALVIGVILHIGFSATNNAPKSIDKAFFLFWGTQGLSSEEYDQYKYAFDVERLNDATGSEVTDLGSGADNTVGVGVGNGFDLSDGFSKNAGLCFLTAFAWHLLVLCALKLKDHKKQR